MRRRPVADASRRLGIVSDAVAASHVDGVTVMHVGNGRLFAANRAGARIWDALRRGLTEVEIAAELSGEYGIPNATAREHVHAFLSELERQQLIERRVAP